LIVRGLTQSVAAHEIHGQGELGEGMVGPVAQARAVLTRELKPSRLDQWFVMSLDGVLQGVKATGEVTPLWTGGGQLAQGQAHLLDLARGANASLIGLVDESATLKLWRTDVATVRFAASASHVTEAVNMRMLLVGDFDGDGLVDLAVEDTKQRRGIVPAVSWGRRSGCRRKSPPFRARWSPECLMTSQGST
jgi:hypothetical protein